MPVHTTNAYGNISISEESIAQVASLAAQDCYGIVDLVNKGVTEGFMEMFRKVSASRGVKVITSGDNIYLSLNVIMKYGVSIDAVAESLKKTVRYVVEKFSGMKVRDIEVNVVGIKV